ncbi:uncharacterized protein DS421_14g453310 [Arachis hypogaea]|nr:uncharacterized protein DS421_14g453310 [Arachis hypogaea]
MRRIWGWEVCNQVVVSGERESDPPISSDKTHGPTPVHVRQAAEGLGPSELAGLGRIARSEYVHQWTRVVSPLSP